MGKGPRWWAMALIAIAGVACAGLPGLGYAQGASPTGALPSSATTPPVEITAENLEYDQVREEYMAQGSVVVIQGPVRLTADRVILHKLSGQVTAQGHVHVRDAISDLWTEQLVMNVNTEAGVITEGRIYLRERNSFVTGRRIRRLSETHYRIQDGSFTNCDAKDGEIPAWRFTFRDLDFDWNDSLYGEGMWFNINDVPVVPFPAFRYPLGGNRKTGLLIPTVGIDNVFGFRYQQGFFWAIDPSQDLTISPLVLSKRGGGGDLEYRYVLSRKSRGSWLVSSLYDTDEDQGRAQIRGAHVQQVNPDLSIRAQVNYSTDREFLEDLSSSGVLRALPSQESTLLINQRLSHGTAYLHGQYIQPLNSGGRTTFQRLPEIGHRLAPLFVGPTPLLFGMESTFVHFAREQGFQVSRLDFLPSLSTQGLHLGHVLGLRPQLKMRETVYTRGATSKDVQNRETFWAAMEAFTKLSRRFSLGAQSSLRHSIEPRVIYEFVPPTDQAQLVQVDAVDNLIKKSLVTYSLSSRLSQVGNSGQGGTWLDFFAAQSYHVGNPPSLAKPFSDIWVRAAVNTPATFTPFFSTMRFSIDSFIDPGEAEFSQLNADARIQDQDRWYVEVGQRYARSGPQVRRGDIWNPISFNEVVLPQDKIVFLTATGAVRLPWGVTVGSRWYHDFRTGQTSEWDTVGLYQNPCRCFSLGLYYIQFPDREQFNFVASLTGLWGTQGLGTQLMESILGPLLAGERGTPWAPR